MKSKERVINISTGKGGVIIMYKELWRIANPDHTVEELQEYETKLKKELKEGWYTIGDSGIDYTPY